MIFHGGNGEKPIFPGRFCHVRFDHFSQKTQSTPGEKPRARPEQHDQRRRERRRSPERPAALKAPREEERRCSAAGGSELAAEEAQSYCKVKGEKNIEGQGLETIGIIDIYNITCE